MAELRYGAIVADSGAPRRERIEGAIARTTVMPVTDALIKAVTRLRAACRHAGHPLSDHRDNGDLWIAARCRLIGVLTAIGLDR